MNDLSAIWMDVVTLVVPRLTVSEMASSLFENVGGTGIKFRWVVHVDPVPEMSSDLEPCLRKIEQLSAKFGDADISVSPKRIGHPASFFNAMSRTRNPCLYMEDDKLFTRRPDLAWFLSSGIDFMNLKSNRTLCPNTCVGLWSRMATDYVLGRMSEFGGNIESWLKDICRHPPSSPLKLVKGYRCTSDIGAESLAKHGLVRVMAEDGNPVYVKGGNVTFVVWEENATLERLEERRRGTLCTGSCPSVGVRKGGSLDLDRITTPFTFFISSDVFPENRSKDIVADEEAFVSTDLIGNSDDPLMFAVARTSLFRRASQGSDSPPEIIRRAFLAVRPERIHRVPLFGTRGGSMHSNKRLKWLKENVRG